VDAAAHLVPVRGRDGQTALHVLAVPFLRAADLPGVSFADTGDGLSIADAVRALHARLVADIAARAGDLPLIGMGHLHCTGGLESEGAERRILVGGSHAVPPDVFPARLDYVALGHLHGPQSLDGGRVRYAGSGFPLSASEIRHRHGVTILEIEGRRITPRHHPLARPAEVLRLPATGTLTLAGLEAALRAIAPVADPDLRPLVYVDLHPGDEAPAVLIGKAEALLRAAPVRPAGVRIHRAVAGDDAPPVMPALSLQDTRPEDLFVAAFAQRHGTAPQDRHMAAFRAIAGEG
jgi:exonuclease SbcD